VSYRTCHECYNGLLLLRNSHWTWAAFACHANMPLRFSVVYLYYLITCIACALTHTRTHTQ